MIYFIGPGAAYREFCNGLGLSAGSRTTGRVVRHVASRAAAEGLVAAPGDLIRSGGEWADRHAEAYETLRRGFAKTKINPETGERTP